MKKLNKNLLYLIIQNRIKCQKLISISYIYVLQCHDPSHMTVSHGISGSWDLNITRSHLQSNSELASDFRSAAWRFSQKSLVLYIKLFCILFCCWLSSMSWWFSDWNQILFIKLTMIIFLQSIISACWATRKWEDQNSKLISSI